MGVPPKPFTISATRSPEAYGRSDTTASSNSSTIASAGAIALRSRPGSPWMPTPISISSSPSPNSGDPFAGGVQAVRATPMVRVTSFTFLPMRTTSVRSRPWAAAAPTALMTKKLPATPRRPMVYVESLTATSSSIVRISTLMPSASAISRPMSKAIRSPV